MSPLILNNATEQPGTTVVNIAVGAASVNAALPAATTYLYMTATTNLRFRTGLGAQTAVATDTLFVPGAGYLIYKVPQGHDNIAVIQDTAGGNFHACRAMEG